MTWRDAHRQRPSRITPLVTFLALSSIVAFGEDRPKTAPSGEGVAVERLLEQLNSDPERNSGETFSDWYRRISLKNLDVANKIVAHPDATPKHKAAAIDRKLSALDLLAGRDPDRYEQRWRAFADHVVDEYPGSKTARDATLGVLNRQISDDPADPRIVSEIERFARSYPDSVGRTSQLYYRLTALLYDRDPKRALDILDRAIRSSPPESAASLRQHKNGLTMIGSRLTTSWSKLDGSQFTIEYLRGKVVFMYSWATWCAPCVAKFPMLNELHARYHQRGLEIVAVSQDDDPSDVVEFLKEKGLPWIQVMHSDEYRKKYGSMGTPGSVLIDRDGVVAARALFGRDEIETAVKQLLDKPATVGSSVPADALVP